MAYRIRYNRRLRHLSQRQVVVLQWMSAGMVLLAAVLCVYLGGGWREAALAVFLPSAEAAGEGWYEILARACAGVIHGAP